MFCFFLLILTPPPVHLNYTHIFLSSRFHRFLKNEIHVNLFLLPHSVQKQLVIPRPLSLISGVIESWAKNKPAGVINQLGSVQECEFIKMFSPESVFKLQGV